MSSLTPTASPFGRARAISRLRPAALPALSHRLVVVSNRIAAGSASGSSGGLAVAVEAALRASGGIWLGWSGEIAETPAAAPALEHAGAVTYAKLDLTRQDYEEYYAGFANRVLWPLFHFRPDLIDYRREHYAGYRRVNDLFARRLAPMLQPDDIIWAQDYHLMTLGHALRQHGVTQPLGFFFHTPFPPGELFRTVPPHADLMRAMCAYDLIGFQTEADRDGFLRLSRARAQLPRRHLARHGARLWPRRARRRLPDRHRCRRDRDPRAPVGRQPPPPAPARQPARPRADGRGRPARLFQGPAGALPRLRAAVRALPRHAQPHHLSADRAADAQRRAGISA